MKANKIHRFAPRYSAAGSSHYRAWILDQHDNGHVSVIEIERTSTKLRPFTVDHRTDHVVLVECGTEFGARRYIARKMRCLRREYPLLARRSTLAAFI